MKLRLLWQRLVPALVIVCLCATCLQACPTCKDAVAEGPQHANIIRGYFWSILFMMSMPFLIFGSLATMFYQQVRKARAAEAASLRLGIDEFVEAQPETAGMAKTE